MSTLRAPRIDYRLEELRVSVPRTGLPNMKNRLGAQSTGGAKGKLSCLSLGESSTEEPGKMSLSQI